MNQPPLAQDAPGQAGAMKNQPFARRLRNAWAGVTQALAGELNFRLQCAGAVAVVLALIWLRPPPAWWALLLFCCGAVLGAELFNCALEQALDRLHPQTHPAVGLAKDLAAGAVLVISMTSLAVFVVFVLARPWE